MTLQDFFAITSAVTIQELRDTADPRSQKRAGDCNPSFFSLDPTNGRLTFITTSTTWNTPNTQSGRPFTQVIDLLDWERVVPEEVRAEHPTWDQIKSDFPELLNSEVHVHCYCPAFIYWGHWYNLYVLETSFDPITGPNSSDPGFKWRQETFSCKHLLSVYATFFV